MSLANTLVHLDQGGKTLTIEAGGSIVLNGGTITNGGVAQPKLAMGTVVLDGSNPTTVVTGLTTILGAVLTLQDAAAPNDPDILTYSLNATPGSLDINAWKATNSSTTTEIASTNAALTVSWIAWGT